MSDNKILDPNDTVKKSWNGGKVDISDIEDFERFSGEVSIALTEAAEARKSLSSEVEMSAAELAKNIMAGYDEDGNSKEKMKKDEGEDPEEEEGEEEEEGGMDKNMMAGYDKMGNSKAKMKKGDEEDEDEEEEEEEEVEKAVSSSVLSSATKIETPNAEITVGTDDVVGGDTITWPSDAATSTTTTPTSGDSWSIDTGTDLRNLQIVAASDPNTASMVAFGMASDFADETTTETTTTETTTTTTTDTGTNV